MLAAREIILRLDQAQEHRVLSHDELDIRKSLKAQCLGLASLERTIARQRARVLHLHDGDANTRYFHLVARGLCRRKRISSIVDGERLAILHNDMEQIMLNYFCGLMGAQVERANGIDIAALGLPLVNSELLDMPFTQEEVWNVVKDLPPDKAQGPDGFTGKFYQTGWPIIKNDVMLAVNAFLTLNRSNLGCLNSALIVLIAKKPDAAAAKDYRPITLVHSFSKLVSKLLANRLAPQLATLIQANQSAFIRNRSILDNFKYVQRAAVLLRKKKIPKVLLKLDISKAFDTLSWSFLFEALEAYGFSTNWRGWISTLLRTATSRILLNGQPGPIIQHRRGVRQGDPLSPMLFILDMDVLNRLFQKAADVGDLSPLGNRAIKFHCSIYADDVILFMHPSHQQAWAIK